MPLGEDPPGIRVSIGDKVPEKKGSESFGVPSVLKCILYKLVLFREFGRCETNNRINRRRR